MYDCTLSGPADVVRAEVKGRPDLSPAVKESIVRSIHGLKLENGPAVVVDVHAEQRAPEPFPAPPDAVIEVRRHVATTALVPVPRAPVARRKAAHRKKHQ